MGGSIFLFMQFSVLGPLEVADDGRTVPLGGPKQRLVLALLLLRANQSVGADQLIDEVWGEEPPDGARGTLQSYVSHLRKALGPARIEGGTNGYVLAAEPSEVDALRFEGLVGKARTALTRDPSAASEALAQALALWRGRALSDLADEPSLRPDITRLEELRLTAVETRLEAELALGREADLVPELQSLIERHPLRERLWGQLMLALVRSGRQAEALDAYGRARQVLGDELGIDPSQELQRLHERILRQDPALEIGGRPLRGYRLVDQIGEGAFGAVHRAIQPQVGREVAVKAVHPWLANHPDFIRRFETEAQLVARLEHPHIVPLYDYWREPDAAYLVMRFMRGGNLKKVLATETVDPEPACRVVEQVAAALAVAHRLGVVHRDVKPANILFDEERNAYLSDFGIATDLTRNAPPGALPHPLELYTSPEELRGEEVTPRTDVYALGIVAFEMLTGKRPFEGPEAAERLQREPIPSVRLQRPELPETIDEVLRRATAADPAARFADTPELATALRRAVEPGPTTVAAEPGRELRNPYKGLRAFQEADAADFFGRDALVEGLVERLSEPGNASRLLAVVGPSGSGKSSVVRAGLIPALRRGALPGSESWYAVEMIPGAHPFEELERALLGIAARSPASLLELLEGDRYGLVAAVDRVVPDDRGELVLVVDQFEEIFSLVQDEETRRAFLDSLAAAVSDPRSRVRVVLTLRADFFDRPLQYQGFGDLLARRTYAVTPLSADELERAIAGPAERVGGRVESKLLADVVAEVSDQAGSLPLMQYALTELFDWRGDGALTLETYRQVGGVSGALVRRAEKIYGELDEGGARAARQLFLRLVEIGETDDTRHRVLRSELASLDVDRAAVERVIDMFGRHRLLSFDRDPITRGPTVEVAHEALLREWKRLQGWIEGAREDLHAQRRLATSAGEWSAAGRDQGFLLKGARLTQIENWAATSTLALTATEREHLQASVEQRDAELAEERTRAAREAALERRSLRRMRALVAVLALAATLTASLSFVALGQRGRARDQARIAAARELAAAALANLDVDPERSILLAMESVSVYRKAGTPVARDSADALYRAIGTSRIVATLPSPGGQADISVDGLAVTDGEGRGTNPNVATIWEIATGKPVITLRNHGDHISEIDFSSDGTRVMTGSLDGTAVLWDVKTGARLVTLIGHSGDIGGTSVSPRGDRLATSSADGTVAVWDAATGRRLLVLGGQGFAGGNAFSADGKKVAAAVGDGVTVWDARTGKRLVHVPGHNPWTNGVAFSPDGRLLATTGEDARAKIWDLKSGRLLRTLEGHTGRAVAVEFNLDGTLLATAGGDHTARLWDVGTGREVLVLRGHTAGVRNLSFDESGTRLITGSDDGTAKVWDVDLRNSREATAVVFRPGAEPNGLVYSRDGRQLLVVGREPALWDGASVSRIAALPLSKSEGFVTTSAVFDPNGSNIILGGTKEDAPASAVWDPRAGRIVRIWKAAESFDRVADAAIIAPDGRTLLARTGNEGHFYVFDIANGTVPFGAISHNGASLYPVSGPYQAAFSADSKYIVTVGWDLTAARVFESANARLFSPLPYNKGLNAGFFSPDGKRVVLASQDAIAIVWDVRERRQLAAMRGHAAAVVDAVFSPDGTLVATAAGDGSARLWDAATGEELLKFPGPTSGFRKVAMSPDGNTLATIGGDGVVRVFPTRIEDVLRLARSRITRGFTLEECQVYLHLDRCPAA